MVNVTSRNPVSVSLIGPQGTQPVTKQGTGQIKLDIPQGSFPDDSLWFVSIDDAANSKLGSRGTAASGTLNISYLPAEKSVIDRISQAKTGGIKE